VPRDYQKLTRGEGMFVPRWIVAGLAALGVLFVALRILVPPSWIVQRLDSPDGRRSAQLLRTQYLRQSFVVRLRETGLWHTAFYSAPITNDFRSDLGERLAWSADSTRVFLRVGGQFVWGYDFAVGRGLSIEELAAGPGT
jgi:hypothetical protein